MEDKMKSGRDILSIVSRKWKNRLFLEAGWVFLVVMLLLYAVISVYEIETILLIPLSLFITGLLWMNYRKEFPKENQLIKLIDEQFEKAEYSTALMYRNPNNLLENIQKKKLEDQLKDKLPGFKFPVNHQKSFMIISVFIMICLVSILPKIVKLENESPAVSTSFVQNNQTPIKTQNDSIFLKSLTATIFPPEYTKIRPYNAEDLNLEIPDGSRIKFKTQFNKKPDFAWIDYSSGDSLSLQTNEAWYLPKKNSYFSVYYTLGDKTGFSPLYSTQLINDASPEIVIDGIPSYQNLEYTEISDFSFSAVVKDDYGISDVYMVATITKGSGEAIKFREQKVPVSFSQGKNEVSLNPKMPVESFNMEPGNELYFYLAAVDNRQPEPQISRSESFFFIVEDTANLEFSLEGNLGVDLMPQYFKSQLQIIIDTKELIDQKATIPKKDFNNRSNELAHDQKDLRLKYGQFIGEESESGIEAEREPTPDGANVSSTGENVLSEFGHDHDHENEEGQLMDKGTMSHEDHDHEHAEEDSENPLTEFIHSHEDRETATFYSQTLKSKLRAALSEMWDAELYLRLYDPKTSLPYQYKAYKLIKEIRNHARVYVRRIGFEPPAINEAEARLKKDPEDLYEEPFYSNLRTSGNYYSIRLLLKKISENKIQAGQSNFLVPYIEDAASELANISTEQSPGKFLEELIILRNLKEKNILDQKDIYNLEVLKQRLIGLTSDGKSPASRMNIEPVELMKDFKKEIAQ